MPVCRVPALCSGCAVGVHTVVAQRCVNPAHAACRSSSANQGPCWDCPEIGNLRLPRASPLGDSNTTSRVDADRVCAAPLHGVGRGSVSGRIFTGVHMDLSWICYGSAMGLLASGLIPVAAMGIQPTGTDDRRAEHRGGGTRLIIVILAVNPLYPYRASLLASAVLLHCIVGRWPGKRLPTAMNGMCPSIVYHCCCREKLPPYVPSKRGLSAFVLFHTIESMKKGSRAGSEFSTTKLGDG